MNKYIHPQLPTNSLSLYGKPPHEIPTPSQSPKPSYLGGNINAQGNDPSLYDLGSLENLVIWPRDIVVKAFACKIDCLESFPFRIQKGGRHFSNSAFISDCCAEISLLCGVNVVVRRQHQGHWCRV